MGNKHDHHSSASNAHHSQQKSATGGATIDPHVESFFQWMISTHQNITYQKIMAYFADSTIIRILVESSFLNEKSDNDFEIDTNKLKTYFSELFQAFSKSSIFNLYIDLLFEHKNPMDYETLSAIINDCFSFSLRAFNFRLLQPPPTKRTIDAIIQSIQLNNETNNKTISKSSFKSWVVQEFPELFFGFHSWVLKRIRDKQQETQDIQEVQDASHLMNLGLSWYLVCNLPSIYTKFLTTEHGGLLEKFRTLVVDKGWTLLYNSESHGLSLNRFQSHLTNYKAATVLLVYCESGPCYCVCTTQEYKESPTPYGDDTTRIFRIWNTFKAYDIKSEKNIYLNTKSRILKLGLMFGDQMNPFIKIDEALQRIDRETMKNDTIVSVEVWGCGPAKASLEQNKMKQWESKQLEKMRTAKLNPEGSWSDNPDKEILEFAGIRTEHSERGDI